MVVSTSSTSSSSLSPRIWLTVLVCGLGYFVDIYDLILFSIVRQESLADIGVSAANMMKASETILQWQMGGMLIGGLLFGILADRRGRLSVLLGSILLYSIMNIANAFVSSVEMYALFRFLSGIGLAGELGVAITLVAEIMPKETRGYGTTIVASMGILGAVAAYFVHELFDWRAAFVAGGVLGMLLLVMRVRVHESGMFAKAEASTAQRGNFFMLFTPKRLLLYVGCIAIGLPIWYVVGILVTFSPEFTRESGSMASIVAGQAVMWCYVGLAAGDLVSGLISQWLGSRKRTVLLFLGLTAGLVWWYLHTPNRSETLTYLQTGLLGFGAGYWAVFVTTAAEQFGTNLRATVATTVPNFVRGALVPTLALYSMLHTGQVSGVEWVRLDQPLASAALLAGGVVFLLALVGWFLLHETFGKDLDYVELS